MVDLKQSTAINWPFFAHDVSGDGVTGKVDGDFTKRISKNGGAFAAMTVTITELENGWYLLALTTSHTDTLGALTVSLSASGIKRANLQFRVAVRINDDFMFPNTPGNGVDVSSNGVSVSALQSSVITTSSIAAGAITAAKFSANAIDNAALATNVISADKITDNSITANKIATDAIEASKIAANTLTDAKIAAGAITNNKFAAGAISNTTFTAGAIDAAAIATDAFTAAKFATDCITAAKLAADAVTEIQAAIAAGSVASVVGSVGSVAAGGITSASFAAGAINAAALASDAITAAKIAADAITAAKIADGSIDAAAFAAGAITASVFAANAITSTVVADNALTRAKFASDSGLQTIRSGTAQAGTSTTITLDAGASAIDNFYSSAPTLVFIVGGTGVGQARFSSGYVGATKVLTVDGTWVTNPDATSTFAILPFGSIPGAVAPTAGQVADAVWDEAISGHLGAGSTGSTLNAAGTFAGSGAFTITVTVTDGTNPLQNAFVRAQEGATVVTGITNASGQINFALNAATYNVGVTKAGYQFTPTTRTVTGNQAGTLVSNLVMSAVSIPPPPADANMCSVFGNFENMNNQPMAGVTITFTLNPQVAMKADKMITVAPISVTTNSSGQLIDASLNLFVNLQRNDAITPAGSTYLVDIPAMNLYAKQMTLTAATFDLATLVT